MNVAPLTVPPPAADRREEARPSGRPFEDLLRGADARVSGRTCDAGRSQSAGNARGDDAGAHGPARECGPRTDGAPERAAVGRPAGVTDETSHRGAEGSSAPGHAGPGEHGLVGRTRAGEAGAPLPDHVVPATGAGVTTVAQEGPVTSDTAGGDGDVAPPSGEENGGVASTAPTGAGIGTSARAVEAAVVDETVVDAPAVDAPAVDAAAGDLADPSPTTTNDGAGKGGPSDAATATSRAESVAHEVAAEALPLARSAEGVARAGRPDVTAARVVPTTAQDSSGTVAQPASTPAATAAPRVDVNIDAAPDVAPDVAPTQASGGEQTIDGLLRVVGSSGGGPVGRTTGLAASVAARVEAAVAALEHTPPPQDVRIEVDGLVLHVRLRGEVVRVQGEQLPSGWDADLSERLGQQGYELEGGSGEGRREHDESPEHPATRPASTPDTVPSGTAAATTTPGGDLRL